MSDKETVELTEETSARLRRLNLWAAGLHFVTSGAQFALTDRDNTVPSYTYFPNDLRGRTNLWGPDPEKRGDTIVGYYSGAFLLCACIDHLLCATLLKDYYEHYLKRGQNHIRWIEYSVSASLMHVMIASLSGVFDMHLLFCIFGLTATTMLFGLLQEMMSWRQQGSPDEKSLLPFWLGCVPHIFNWSVILCYFFYNAANGDPPAFVWAIIIVLICLDSTFAINMYFQQKEIGAWSDYIKGEVTFIVLSFTAKQALAWLNYGGARSLSNDER